MSKYSNPNSFTWSGATVWNKAFDFGSVPISAEFYVFTDYTESLQPSARPTRTVFYVGQTINLQGRLKEHWNKNIELLFQTASWKLEGRQVYVRWAVDDRASIESDLINFLQATLNDRLSKWS